MKTTLYEFHMFEALFPDKALSGTLEVQYFKAKTV